MPHLQSIATVLPRYEIPQSAVQARVASHFGPAFPAISRYLPIFRHANIDTRRMVRPLEWWDEPRSFGTCNNVFIEEALVLGREAILACLEPTGLTPGDIDHLIVVTTTGLAAPSLDALLIHDLGMNRHTRRTPIWGLGCAGGLGGLARAYDYARAEPTQRVMLVNIEFCSLTYLAQDLSKRNLIATSLFGDGVSAVLVSGDDAPASGPVRTPQIVDTLSTLYPDSADIMGWNVIDGGFEVVFSSRIPSIVRDEFPALLHEFLARHGLTQADIGRFLLHPGGAKVIAAYEEALGLDPEALEITRQVLRRYGNMSSATIFFVVEEALRQAPLAAGEYGVMAVFGPGFSAELVLIRG
jgi:alkylresorcinol/alkylpyrone synthase